MLLFKVSFMNFIHTFAVKFRLLVAFILILGKVFFNLIISNQQWFADLFPLLLISFLEFSKKIILILGPCDGVFDLIKLVVNNFWDMYSFSWTVWKSEKLIQGLLELLSLFKNSFRGLLIKIVRSHCDDNFILYVFIKKVIWYFSLIWFAIYYLHLLDPF